MSVCVWIFEWVLQQIYGKKTNAEMLNPRLRNSLTKQGYKLIGSHSGVKLCRFALCAGPDSTGGYALPLHSNKQPRAVPSVYITKSPNRIPRPAKKMSFCYWLVVCYCHATNLVCSRRST